MKLFKHIMVVGAGVVGAIYVLNPTAGIIELIPDNFPIVGNLDEAAATALVINCLVYFRKRRRSRRAEGIDPTDANEPIDANDP